MTFSPIWRNINFSYLLIGISTIFFMTSCNSIENKDRIKQYRYRSELPFSINKNVYVPTISEYLLFETEAFFAFEFPAFYRTDQKAELSISTPSLLKHYLIIKKGSTEGDFFKHTKDKFPHRVEIDSVLKTKGFPELNRENIESHWEYKFSNQITKDEFEEIYTTKNVVGGFDTLFIKYKNEFNNLPFEIIKNTKEKKGFIPTRFIINFKENLDYNGGKLVVTGNLISQVTKEPHKRNDSLSQFLDFLINNKMKTE